MADKLDVIKTCSNLDVRLKTLSGVSVTPNDWILEFLVQVSLLVRICNQQQEEIDRLKRFNPLA